MQNNKSIKFLINILIVCVLVTCTLSTLVACNDNSNSTITTEQNQPNTSDENTSNGNNTENNDSPEENDGSNDGKEEIEYTEQEAFIAIKSALLIKINECLIENENTTNPEVKIVLISQTATGLIIEVLFTLTNLNTCEALITVNNLNLNFNKGKETESNINNASANQFNDISHGVIIHTGIAETVAQDLKSSYEGELATILNDGYTVDSVVLEYATNASFKTIDGVLHLESKHTSILKLKKTEGGYTYDKVVGISAKIAQPASQTGNGNSFFSNYLAGTNDITVTETSFTDYTDSSKTWFDLEAKYGNATS